MDAVQYSCTGCGADLRFEPGAQTLVCAHCGTRNTLPDLPAPAAEIDFEAALRDLASLAPTIQRPSVSCNSCGATVEFPEHVTASSCCYCGNPIVATATLVSHIRPNAVLPFAVTTDQARALFERWIRSRWFAPGDFKRLAVLEGALVGVYLPYWTYDCRATSRYTGRKGIYYYVNVPYTTTVNGKRVTRMRRERRTRWYPASGTVRDRFNDILVSGGSSLNARKLHTLQPWDLKACVAYSDQYLSGFRAETYRVGLREGFDLAKQAAVPAIERSIRADIGGDTQVISRYVSDYDEITFKHLLLPVWLCAYRYRDRPFQIMVNARTGELVGDRPWSAWKISFLILAILAALGAIVLAFVLTSG